MAETVATYDFLSPPTVSGDLGALAHYRVIDELGKGGMGYVFRAEDSKLQRSVALKVMNQKVAATSNSRQRFLHEARAMAAVHHDNVATIFEVGESDGTPFMAMEMLKGETLEAVNKEKSRLGYEKIIDYAQQITRGLAAAHAKGIVHRDIKPANIWIEEGTERIKILDFGLALASTPVDHLSGRGAVIGTPGYLSPEQARSEPLDDRSDLYSLGVVLYELATGQLPLQSGSVSGQLIAILAHRPASVQELNPDIPKPLCDLIHRLLRKEPRMRPQSAAALAAELELVREKCDATSQVAQAINKLQVGLTEVVSKSDSGAFAAVIDDFPESIPDPLSSIPTATSSGVGPASSGRFVVPTPPSKAKAGSVGPNWKVYGPLLAIAALIVAVLPITAFMFDQAGRSTEPLVVMDIPVEAIVTEKESAAERIVAELREKERKAARELERQRAEAESSRSLDPDPESTPGNANAAINATVSLEANRTVDGGKSVPLSENLPQDVPLVPDPKSPPAESGSPVDPSPKATEPKAPEPKAPEPKATEPKATEPESPEPKAAEPTAPPVVARVLAATDKRFADVTLRKGTTVNYGSSETLSVWTRGGVEVEHAYIRFDLGKIKSVKKTIVDAKLTLTVPKVRPIGSLIRLYGIPLKPKEMLWPEHKVVWSGSPSDIGTATSPPLTLDKIPVLENQEIGKAAKAKDELKIQFSSQDLVKFISQSPDDVITFALAGSAKETNEKIEFVSSEHDTLKAFAPTLRVRFPQPPPTKAKVDVAQIRETISRLKGMDTKPLERIINLIENDKIDEAVEASNQLVEEILGMKLPERISERAVKAVESIKAVAEKLQDQD